MQTLKIIIKDTVIQSSIEDKILQKEIRYFQGDDEKYRYCVSIFLDGPDVIYVEKVKYILHQTFKQRERTVSRTFTNPNCSLVIWTWGTFEIPVTIFLKSGETIETSHYLTFDKQINESKKSGDIKFFNTGSSSIDSSFDI